MFNHKQKSKIMDFKDQLKNLAQKIVQVKDTVKTEEATKNAFIMPFIMSLGYDVFNPNEVVPEKDCDLTKKKGDKIDYTIVKDGSPIILIECKHWEQNLNLHATQLQKYYVASNARFGVLTNGIEYRFYTDIEKPNIMDEKPFLVVDLTNLKDAQIEELKKFHKSYFDVDNIFSTASELKYANELKTVIQNEFTTPSDDFTKFFAKKVYDGVITQKVLTQFTDLVKRSINGYVNDLISDRLKSALQTQEDISAQQQPTPQAQPAQQPQQPQQQDNTTQDNTDTASKIVTTQEEMEGYLIVKAILREKIDVNRISYKDSQTYFAIYLDDNSWRPIARLYFNAKSKKYIATFDENKKEVKHEISSLDDIFKYSNEIFKTVDMYDGK